MWADFPRPEKPTGSSHPRRPRSTRRSALTTLASSDSPRPARPDEYLHPRGESLRCPSWYSPPDGRVLGVRLQRGCSRRCARRSPGGALHRPPRARCFRQGTRGPSDREDAVLSARLVRGRQVLCPIHHRNYRDRTACTPQAACCSTTRFPRGLEFVTLKITWNSAAIRLGSSRSAPRTSDSDRDLGFGRDYGFFFPAMWLMLHHYRPRTSDSRPGRPFVRTAWSRVRAPG